MAEWIFIKFGGYVSYAKINLRDQCGVVTAATAAILQSSFIEVRWDISSPEETGQKY